MEVIKNPVKRAGEQTLGQLYDTGKVRKRREWRGIKDTFYDYTRWLYLVSVLYIYDVCRLSYRSS